ncbi:MAG: hypothetical protein R3Y43_05595 [Alphaproteobacteria bacterium]
MTNFILQATKKQYLTILLARYDCLFLLKDVHSFQKQIPLAKKFQTKMLLSKTKRIENLLISNPRLSTLLQEVLLTTKIITKPYFVAENGFYILRNIEDRKFFLNLLLQDFNNKKTLHKLKSRLDLLSDMRLYGADIENFCDSRRFCADLIDWPKTNKEELYIKEDKNSLKLLNDYYKNINLEKKETLEKSKNSFHHTFKMYNNDIIEPLLEGLNPKDFGYLLKSQSKAEKRKYWSKTSAMLLGFVIVIIVLYYLV